MDWDAFLTVHKDLPRQGPGGSEDVAWAAGLANISKAGSICDAGCGTGGDISDLLALVPDGNVSAIDEQSNFIQFAKNRFQKIENLYFYKTDMAHVGNIPQAPFDMIWCAGALYFLGIERGLELFKAALKPEGVVAFSEPCYFGTPSDAATAFWDGYDTGTEQSITERVREQGFTVLGTRKLPDASWEAYYQPMEERIKELRPDASARLTQMLDMCAEEVRLWREVKNETGYLLVVAKR